MQKDNIYQAPLKPISKERFEALIQTNGLKIERIISPKNQQSPASGWYDQTEAEWVMVLKGEARILLENAPNIDLKAGDYINIPAHTKHKVQTTTETLWLAVHYE